MNENCDAHITQKNKKYFSFNAVNEVLNLIANLLVNFANVTIPIAMANILNGFQGAFVFILGAIGVKVLPKYFKEDLSKKIIVQKVSCIVLSVVGLIVIADLSTFPQFTHLKPSFTILKYEILVTSPQFTHLGGISNVTAMLL